MEDLIKTKIIKSKKKGGDEKADLRFFCNSVLKNGSLSH
jgi:hypothetical protein